ncbi:hypothetical protein CH06BL_33420 [Chromobacterium haemolyticum]|nr:hypothetical protein CH06BL_33420 [Chromobacterium haemolyticum]
MPGRWFELVLIMFERQGAGRREYASRKKGAEGRSWLLGPPTRRAFAPFRWIE